MATTQSLPHPFFDQRVGSTAVITNLDGPCVGLSEGLADFIVTVRETTSKSIVIIVPDGARVTPAFDRLTEAAGCVVLVREKAGLRGLHSGRWSRRITDFLSVPVAATLTSKAFFAVPPLTDVLDLSISIYHPPRTTTVLGRVIELIGDRLLPGAGLGWGRYEPAGAPWDRDRLTELAREHMPEAHMVVAAHDDDGGVATGTLTASRTANGLEEYVELSVVPSPSLPREAWAARVCDLFEDLGANLKPQFALATRSLGHPDACLPLTLRTAPTPLAILIGAPGIKQLGVNAGQIASAHGGTTVGRGRRRGLLVPLETGRTGDWSALAPLLASLDGGTGRLARVLESGTQDRGSHAP